MSFKNPRDLIAVISVIAALMAGTVLLGGYANSKPAEATYEAPIKACQALGGGCPMMAGSATCPKMMVAQAESTGCSGMPCMTGCPKPCCAGENAEGCCDNPCPFPCPKPCCAEDGPMGCCGTAGAAGCPMTALETAAE